MDRSTHPPDVDLDQINHGSHERDAKPCESKQHASKDTQPRQQREEKEMQKQRRGNREQCNSIK